MARLQKGTFFREPSVAEYPYRGKIRTLCHSLDDELTTRKLIYEFIKYSDVCDLLRWRGVSKTIAKECEQRLISILHNSFDTRSLWISLGGISKRALAGFFDMCRRAPLQKVTISDVLFSGLETGMATPFDLTKFPFTLSHVQQLLVLNAETLVEFELGGRLLDGITVVNLWSTFNTNKFPNLRRLSIEYVGDKIDKDLQWPVHIAALLGAIFRQCKSLESLTMYSFAAITDHIFLERQDYVPGTKLRYLETNLRFKFTYNRRWEVMFPNLETFINYSANDENTFNIMGTLSTPGAKLAELVIPTRDPLFTMFHMATMARLPPTFHTLELWMGMRDPYGLDPDFLVEAFEILATRLHGVFPQLKRLILALNPDKEIVEASGNVFDARLWDLEKFHVCF